MTRPCREKTEGGDRGTWAARQSCRRGGTNLHEVEHQGGVGDSAREDGDAVERSACADHAGR